MSLTSVLNTATSGMMAAQTALRTVSDNIANVNTPGYVRKELQQSQLSVDGIGMGVRIDGVKRVTDQYLQLASLTATSDASRWNVVAQYLDTTQSLFGNPTSDTYFFNRLDTIWSGFAAAANDPSSSLSRTQAISNVEDFLTEATRVNEQINQIARNLDSQIAADVSRASDLLKEINQLNVDISRATVANSDASGAQNIQSGLIDELSKLMNVKIAQRADGGVTVRSPEGILLAGDGGAATLTYVSSDNSRGYVSASPAFGGGVGQAIQIDAGEIRGLLDLRDVELPRLSDQLGEFVTRTADAINAAHNDSAAVPPPTSLVGKNTGQDVATAFNNFTGSSTVAIVNASGVVQRQVTIDFTNGQMSIDGGAPASFGAASNIPAALDAALGAFGDADFTNGVLTIKANGGAGVAIDEGDSKKAGKGFSHFFGLNDLIKSTAYSYDTGLKGTDAHGFTPSDQITLRLAQSDGKPIGDVSVTVPPAGTMDDLLAALNSTTSGVGLYGQFSLDPDGAMIFTPVQPINANFSVVSDSTKRGAGGPSISQLFGLGNQQRSSRASSYTVDPSIVASPSKLGLAQLDLTVGAGQPALRLGDGSGARALAGAGEVPMGFSAAGGAAAVTMTLSRYASEFSGSIGRNAATAETRKTSADAVQTEATNRRQSVEGVNLDEELVRLTTYQQAFAASARMIQAAKELFDVLTAMV